MARPLRIEHIGAWYHITARGNERRAVFRDDGDRTHFLELLGRTTERFGVDVCCFALMDNHYHLLLRLREAHLSRSLQWLNLSYTAWFNRRHDRSGHLFQGRFKSIVFDAAAALELSRYVHLNPVRVAAFGLAKDRRRAARLGVGEAPNADMIRERLDHLRRYRWSSYGACIGARSKPPWLCCEAVLEMNRGAKPQRQESYRRYVEQGVREGLGDADVWTGLKEKCILGGERFLTQLRGSIQGHDEEQTAAQRLRRVAVSWPEIVAALEKLTGEPWEGMRDRHGDRSRDLALYLGRMRGGMKLKELAEACGVKHYGAVAMALRRYENRMQKDKREKQKLNTAIQMLNVKM